MFNAQQKRLLALDGGGILGIISLHILKKIEDDLRPLLGKGEGFRLRDFFDYIAGTSTGAIIAAGLALGYSVQELIDFYEKDGPRMFRRSRLLSFHHMFSRRPLAALLKAKLGKETILEMQQEGKLSRSKHLLIVTQNVSTDSPWPLSTNPNAQYNKDTSRDDCNLRAPLWRLVRASTAAPVFFSPEVICFTPGNEKTRHVFEDGGVTPYNNPSFLLYRMATLHRYNCGWPDGEQKMMLVSVGTGDIFRPQPRIRRIGRFIWSNAASLPMALMQRVSVENDILCRTVGRCVFGAEIDREIGALEVPLSDASDDLGRRFLYARYNPNLTRKGLKALGLHDLAGIHFGMSDVAKIPQLQKIGATYAAGLGFLRDFAPFVKAHRESAAPELILSSRPSEGDSGSGEADHPAG